MLLFGVAGFRQSDNSLITFFSCSKTDKHFCQTQGNLQASQNDKQR
jgi:hypothetical protein